MQESQRTLIFVGTAAVTIALAAGTHWAMQPVSLDEFSDIGEQFYPDFNDPNSATGLRVAAYNEDAARVDVFNVEFKDGLWRIPSHHNYPADGEDRLAKTATSIIGIEREAIVSTSDDDFKRLGVLDPLDETVTGTEGRGDRITILEGDNVLADYIIGNKVEGQNNTYHIRKPDENRTYRATLNLDISTKFADWIEPGLLDVRRADLREIVIDRYSIDETRGVLVPGEVNNLSRESSSGSWELEGIAANEKVKTSEVNSVINALEDLKIVGVRAKPPGLSADLKGEGGTKLDPIAFIDLQNKGYFVDAQGALVSNEGEVRVGTAEGVLYVLRFGEVFTGSDVEIEVGNAEEDDGESESSTAGEEDADSSDDVDEDSVENEQDNESPKQNRYLFITAQFDESLIGDPGEKPVKPEQPAEKSEPDESRPDEEAEVGNEATDAAEDGADADEPDTGIDESDSDVGESDSGVDESDSGVDQPEEQAEGDSGETDEKSPDEEEYQQALAEYETNLKQWEREQQSREEKLEQGRERVSELNIRFADWYYVISAESFDDIRVARADLVETEEPDEETEANASEEPASAPPVPEEQPRNSSEPALDASEKPAVDDPELLPPDDPDFAPSSPDQPPSDASPDTSETSPESAPE